MVATMKTRSAGRKIPEFRTERDAALFWETHDLADFWPDSEAASDVSFERPRKQVVTLRLERPLIQRLRAIAVKNGIPYSTLIRMWLVERCAKAE